MAHASASRGAMSTGDDDAHSIETIEILEKLAALGHAEAQFELGFILLNGRGVAQDLRRAVALFQKAADQGHAMAQWRLGLCYEKGTGVSVDKPRAVAYFKRSSDQGLVNAQLSLGLCYGSGAGIAQDDQRAVALYTLAANQGSAGAQLVLSGCFRDGIGVAQDLVQAAKYSELAADQGIVEAQYGLGYAYHLGLGVRKDPQRALQQWQRAIDQGHAGAHLAVSAYLFYGIAGLSQDIEVAYKLCKVAASQGLAQALSFLSTIKAALEPRACASCSVVEPVARSYPKCNACRVVCYCDVVCQRAHWKMHKLQCKALAGKAEADKRDVFSAMLQGRRVD